MGVDASSSRFRSWSSTDAMVRFGLIGAGRWGKVYIRTLLSLGERCRLTHLGTSNPKNAALVQYPVEVMADWRRVIEAKCDALLIAAPPSMHAEILEACLQARKPCIVEKPLCLDVAAAERLHQRVEEAQVPVLVNHTQLFNPAYQALKEAVAKEAIRVIVSEGLGLGAFRAHTPTLWDWGPHDLSLCLDLVGGRPVDVAALGGPKDPRGSPELVSVRLDFPGGTCAWIQVGRLYPQKRRIFSLFTDEHVYLLDDLASEKLTVLPFRFSRREVDGAPDPGQKRTIPIAPDLPPMANMIGYFLDGLEGGDRRYFGTDLALEVVRLLDRCESALSEQDTH